MTARFTWFALMSAASMTVVATAQDTTATLTPVPPTALRVAPTTEGVSTGPVAENIVISPNSPTLLTFEAGVTFLRRSRPHRSGLIGEVLNLDTDVVLREVSTRSIDFEFEAGPNVMVRLHDQHNGTWDLRWLGLDSWSDRVSLETEDADPIGTRTPVSPFAFVLEEGAELGGIRARAHSYFHSVQFGRTGVVCDSDERTVTHYLGFRYFYFRDALEIERAGTVDNEAYGWGGNNNLFGGEIGVDCARHYGFMTFGAKARAGGYFNYADLKGQYNLSVGSQPNVPPVSFQTESDDFTGVSGVLDLGVYSTIHANQHFSLKFGYDFMVLTNLVAGSENMQPTLLTITPVPGSFPLVTRGSLDAHGNSTVLLHGLSVTGEVVW
jgi:hypothetical protein